MAAASESLASGRGIQVVSPSPDHSFHLDLEALSALLLREDLKDRAVVVVSVAGAFRKGKSFLLDFFLRYLHHTYILEGSGDWLGSEDEPLRGFSWRGGSKRDTTGLLLWSQPFKATLSNGEKVVILLMDTQGTFDSMSTVHDNVTVFALSTMLSSVQIYNLSQNIEEDDLQQLQLFTEYGRLAARGGGGKPFQKLQMLVRDWSFTSDYAYGAEGGRQLLEKWLEIPEGQHEDLQAVRRDITSCFEELACFLMPHPGLIVARNPKFDGKISDIDPEFKKSLRELVPMLLAPQNLVPKRIQGAAVRARDLLLYFKAYLGVFNGTELPQPKTILQATAEANNLSAVAEARATYDAQMEEASGGAQPYMTPAQLDKEHRRARDKALEAFRSRRKLGGQELASSYETQLIKELDEEYKEFSAHNESKKPRMTGTPVVFAGVALLGWLLSSLGGAVMWPLGLVGTAVALLALGVLALWAYNRVTGNMSNVANQLDKITGVLWKLGLRLLWNSVGNQAVAAAIGVDHMKPS
ncbi:atlastin-like [Choristoneura fumiferana]|uniref:atlastin-like n=1 Tax=Choristoneura fumiferana TaxID=7141 RepID=UPI003D15D163